MARCESTFWLVKFKHDWFFTFLWLGVFPFFFFRTDFADAPGLGCIFKGLVLQGSLFTSDRGPYFEADLTDIPGSGSYLMGSPQEGSSLKEASLHGVSP